MMGARIVCPMNKTPVLLDVDPGIDDALAILLALGSPELRVEAITVVAGNVDVDQGVDNALKIVELAGFGNIPVARGAEAPLLGKLTTARHVHGENGLGDIELPSPSIKPHVGEAEELIVAKVEEHAGDLSFIAVGPLTNLAKVLKRHGRLIPKIRGIVWMGGSFSGGNVTPAAEFNAYNDPEAAETVLESRIPIRMVTLDVTRRTLLRPETLVGVARDAHPVNRFVWDLSDYHRRVRGVDGIFLHDPLAVGIAIDPSLVTTEHVRVEVETKGQKTRGATIANRKGYRVLHEEGSTELRAVGREEIEPNAEITVGVDADRFIEFFLDRVLVNRLQHQ